MKQKLELTWIGKENRPRLEPRILIEDPTKSYHANLRKGNISRGGAEYAEKTMREAAEKEKKEIKSLSLGFLCSLWLNLFSCSAPPREPIFTGASHV
jgi:hypothetical protein